MAFLRILLWPVSQLYGLVTLVRNKFYDWKLFRSVSFDIPVISVGNLCAGGTGKTPHVEYLVRLLAGTHRLATLSRGYKRKSTGFLTAGPEATAETLGDEPYQYATKFDNLVVAVDEKRVRGVRKLLKQDPAPEVILLDDAFQHRSIRAGFSILLTDFYNLYSHDYLLPTGRLREYRSGAKRAQCIVVTKCPAVLSPLTRRRVEESLRPAAGQALYFSYIAHGRPTRIPGLDFQPPENLEEVSVLLLAGIANPYPLERYLADHCKQLEKLIYPDHHNYNDSDIERISTAFDKLFIKNKLIITTEKDMVRLMQPEMLEKIKHLPLCYLPIEVKFHDNDGEAFENQIKDYVTNH